MRGSYLTVINVASICDIKGNNACGVCILLYTKSQDMESSQLTEASESVWCSDLAITLVNAKIEISVDV